MLTPGSPEWVRRVSPSKAAACLGLSPWDSPRAMFHKMRGEVPWDEESAAMERGTLCEPAVLGWWRKHHEHDDWQEQVTFTLGDWCVATPDGMASIDGEPVLIEAKTSARDDDWGTPGTDEIPLYYLTQVYMAMEVARLNGHPVTRAFIPVLFGTRLRFECYVVEYCEEHGARILELLRAFHDSLARDEPPDLDDTVPTYNAVRKIHPDIERGAEVELTRDEARRLVDWCDEIKHTEASVRLAKSTVIDRMGRAQYATHQGTRIARRQPRGNDVTFVVVAKPSDLQEIQ